MTAFILSLLVVTAPQAMRQVSITIQVMQDVQVVGRPEPDGGMRRGRLYTNNPPGFVIKKGQTFEMLKDEGEGMCRIRFAKREYFLSSCPWMPGFRDRQSDIFQIISPQKP